MTETITATKAIPTPKKKFYLREMRSRWIRNRKTNDWVRDTEYASAMNAPILTIMATDIEAAVHAATNMKRERIAATEALGFTRNEKGWQKGNQAVSYLWKVEVCHSCRKCNGTGVNAKFAKVNTGVCYACGGTGDEEKPLNKDGQPYPARSGVNVDEIEVKVSRLAVPA